MGKDGAFEAGDAAKTGMLYRATVRPDWIDYNGHMNVAYYTLVFDLAADAMLDTLGLGEAYRQATGCSVFVRESHVVYDREVVVGSTLEVEGLLLDNDDRRLVLFQQMREVGLEGTVATCEVLCVHVNLASRRSLPWPEGHGAAIAQAQRSDSALPPPARAGRSIALARRRS